MKVEIEKVEGGSIIECNGRKYIAKSVYGIWEELKILLGESVEKPDKKQQLTKKSAYKD